MLLSPGDRLSHYQILSELGRGGMGSVYRARDTRLGREVAIKVSSQQFTERFEREAKVIASLNHPNICTLYDVGPNFLVMELIEGESPKGPLPVETVLDYARQMADALDYAHERAITHRDLKPANLKITPEGVLKVLDFGLAKVGQAHTETPSEDSPTLTMGMTDAGMILGTAAYMPPEQAKGKPVDKRADIWSYGVVLFELLTGKRPFQGADMAELLAAVLRDEAKLDEIPERMRPLIRKCLEKDPRKRLRDIADAMELINSSSSPVTVEKVVEKLVVEKAPPAKPYGWMAAGLLAAGLAVAMWIPRGGAPPDTAMTRLNVDLGPNAIAADYNTFAISPDGRRIVYTVRTEGGTQLATRLLDSAAETRLPGSDGAQNPYFSANGQEVGYFAGGKMKKGSVNGGAPSAFADSRMLLGADWLADGSTFVSLNSTVGITKIPADGGLPQSVTKVSGAIITHRWPSYSAKANALIYTAAQSVGSMSSADVWVQPLGGGDAKVLVRSAYAGRVVESSDGAYLLFVRDGVLFGSVFDTKKLEVTGTAVPLVEDLASDPVTGSGHFDISRSGSLLYRAGREAEQAWPVLLMDQTGATTPLIQERALYFSPRFSPDGKKLAIASRIGTEVTLNVLDLDRGSVNKIRNASYPVWTPDSKYLAVRDSTPPGVGLAWYRADGAGTRQVLYNSGLNLTSYAFSPDGKGLIFDEISTSTRPDVVVLPLDLTDPEHPKAGKPKPLVQTPAVESFPALSGDGKWLAYASNESGRNEIYVQPFPAGSGRWQISASGGNHPLWAPNGRTLYFQSVDNHIMAADITPQSGAIEHGQPKQWSHVAIRNAGDNLSYAIHPDGKRFLVFPAPEPSPETKGNAHVTFLLNFTDELRRKLGPAK